MPHISTHPDIIETVRKLDAAGLSVQDIIYETGLATNKVSEASIYIHAKPEQWYDGMAMDEADLAQKILWMRDQDCKSWSRIAVYGGLPSSGLARKIYEKYTGRSSRGPHYDGRGRPPGRKRRAPRPASYKYKNRGWDERYMIAHGFSPEDVYSWPPEKLRAYKVEVKKDLKEIARRGLNRYWE